MVSVIMPAYNSQRTIEAAINSILNQTYTDLEVIVVNDCSTDATEEVVKTITLKDPRVKYFCNEKNSGVSYTRNFAISKAQGEWIAFLDSDDLWRANKLEVQLKIAEEQKADILYSSHSMIDINGNKCCDDFIVDENTDYNKMLVRNEIGCLTAVVRTDVMRKYTFSGQYAHEDYALWMSILKDGHKAAGSKEVLADYRVYQGSRSSNKLRAAKNRWIIYRKHLKLSLFSSIYYLIKYTIKALKKYS
ncbi:MAG: glycosyltransferase family 2 protein [Clostridia bacterium]|nr:glycosyltransferase family 2 protein [Clostridia bacterium]